MAVANEEALRKQDDAIAQDLDAIAKAKYGGAMGKSHVAAFNRRVMAAPSVREDEGVRHRRR